MDSFLKKLKENKYLINYDNKSITSDYDSSLENVTKPVMCNLIKLSENYRHITKDCLMKCDIDLSRIYMSVELHKLLIGLYDSKLRGIFSLDSLDYSNSKNYYDVYNLLLNDFNYLTESVDGYLIYGIGGNKRIKIGRFLSIIYKTVGENNPKICNIIEQIVNYYRSVFDKINHKFVLLNGRDIYYGYSSSFYVELNHGTPLYNSCMNDKLPILRLYAQNTDKVNLLVMIDDNGKIMGRSLIWETKNGIVMDRVYYTNEIIEKLFINLCLNNEWDYYAHIKWENVQSKKSYRKKLSIKLKTKGIKTFPYMDTFCWSSRINNVFYNDYNEPKILCNFYRSTDGNFKKHLFNL